MTASQALAFVLFAVVAAITPGPSNLILTATGAAVGVVRGLPSLGGQVIGMGCMLFLVTFGLGSVLLAIPGLLLLLKAGGVAVLLWLAWQIATAGRDDATSTKRSLGFWGMAGFQWINPKSWLVSVSAVSTYVHPAAGIAAVIQALGVGLLFLLAALPCCFLWLAFGASVQRWLNTERTARLFNVAMGLLLVGAVLLFLL